MVTNWFKAKKIKVFDWLSQSPGLNPVERIWEGKSGHGSILKKQKLIRIFHQNV